MNPFPSARFPPWRRAISGFREPGAAVASAVSKATFPWRKAMLTLTDSAIKTVRRFLKNAPTLAEGLRVTISGGGCAGFQYGLKLEEAAAADDTVVESHGVKIFIDPASLPLIDGAIIDFVDSLDGSGFKFTNPSAKKNCSCGNSFSA
jgi:iron-sulfur cluster assembly protein